MDNLANLEKLADKFHMKQIELKARLDVLRYRMDQRLAAGNIGPAEMLLAAACSFIVFSMWWTG